MTYIERYKTEELLAHIQTLQDRLSELETEGMKVRTELVVLTNELITRSIYGPVAEK